MTRRRLAVRRGGKKFLGRANWLAFALGSGCIAALIGIVGSSPGRGADRPAKSQSPFAVADYRIGEPIVHGNLTIFPILSKAPRTKDPYITLDEGLKAGTVKVFETGATDAAAAGNAAPAPNPAPAPNAQGAPRQSTQSQPAGANGRRQANANPFANPAESDAQSSVSGDVNQLVLLNRSDKPLYLMPGEIIIGGKQDRSIAQETIIPPGDKPVPLDVYCVEHGRWAGRGSAATVYLVETLGVQSVQANSFALSEKSTDPKQLAAKAQKGEFIGSVGSLSKGGRVAVQGDKEQGKVWDKVAEANAKSKVNGQSGYFTGNYTEEQSLKRLSPYVGALEKKVADQAQIVGVAVAIDGKMDTLDIFGSTPLFRQLWPKLLKSYALDAANAADEAAEQHGPADKPSKSSKSPSAKAALVCTVDDARKFLVEAVSSRGETSKNGDVAVTTASTDHFLSCAAVDSRRAANQPSASGGFGGGVHLGGFAK